MTLNKLSRALAIAGCLALQAACGSSGTKGTGGSTGGTTGGAATSCNVDSDCQCGQVCSWSVLPHQCAAASGGDPGWCNSTPNCLYEGQMCSGTYCVPGWSSASVCNRT